MVNGRLAGTTAAVLVLLQLPAARTETAQTCGIGEATLSLSLKGAGVTEPGLWSNVSTAAELMQRASILGIGVPFPLNHANAWASSIEPGYNLTDIVTGEEVGSTVGDGSSFGTTGFAGIIVTLTWVAPERIAGGYPREPSTQSSLGLHLLHYDAWDKFGNRADRESRLVEVVQVGDAAGGQAGCACLPVAEIQRVSHDARKGHCGDGTFAYSTELLPGQISDISCYPDTYGSSCGAWDHFLPPYCAFKHKNGTLVMNRAPAFCRESWCYVDPTACNLTLDNGNVAAHASDYFDGLYYSYETCGFTDTWSDWATGYNTSSALPQSNDASVAAEGTLVIALLATCAGLFACGCWVCWCRYRWFKQRLKKDIKLDLTVAMTTLAQEREVSFKSRHGFAKQSKIADVMDERMAMMMHTEFSRLEVREPTELDRTSVSQQQEIGHGEFGTVRRGMFTQSSRLQQVTGLAFPVPVAVKVLNDGASAEHRADFAREAVISAQFHNVNVVGMVGVVTESDPYLLVLEFCGGGALDFVVATKDPPVTKLVRYVAGVAAGMAHLASFHFVHRDLAARNVLVDDLDNAKIADFGLSRRLSVSGIYTTHDANAKLPLRWCAPEVFREQRFGESSDVWSFGVTCIEVFAKAQTPYAEWSNAYVCERVNEGYHLPRPARCPAGVYDNAIEPCFATEPDERPLFASLAAMLQTVTWDDATSDALPMARLGMDGRRSGFRAAPVYTAPSDRPDESLGSPIHYVPVPEPSAPACGASSTAARAAVPLYGPPGSPVRYVPVAESAAPALGASPTGASAAVPLYAVNRTTSSADIINLELRQPGVAPNVTEPMQEMQETKTQETIV